MPPPLVLSPLLSAAVLLAAASSSSFSALSLLSMMTITKKTMASSSPSSAPLSASSPLSSLSTTTATKMTTASSSPASASLLALSCHDKPLPLQNRRHNCCRCHRHCRRCHHHHRHCCHPRCCCQCRHARGGGLSTRLDRGGEYHGSNRKKEKYRCTMFWVTHDILLKIHPGQKSGDAVARASVAPMRLHCPICHEGINTLRIIAALEEDGGDSYCNIGIWVIWAHLQGGW